MPRPCAVESHARRCKVTKTHPSTLPDATALRRGVSRSPLPLRRHIPPLFQMPRPCAVESHARRYQLRRHIPPLFQMPRPCAVESHVRRCKVTKTHPSTPPDATALRRGVSRSPLIKTSFHMPRIGSVLILGLCASSAFSASSAVDLPVKKSSPRRRRERRGGAEI